MAKEITFTKLGGKAPFADGGLKLSKSILIDKIEPHEDFKSLFKIGDELLERITNSSPCTYGRKPRTTAPSTTT